MIFDWLAGMFSNDLAIDLGTANTLSLRQGQRYRHQRALGGGRAQRCEGWQAHPCSWHGG